MKERKRGKTEIKEGRIKERMNEMKTSTDNHALQCTVNTAMQQHIHTAADGPASRMHISNPHTIRRFVMQSAVTLADDTTLRP